MTFPLTTFKYTESVHIIWESIQNLKAWNPVSLQHGVTYFIPSRRNKNTKHVDVELTSVYI